MSTAMDDKVQIGERLRQWRKGLNLSQVEVAGRIGRSQGFIGDIERGRQAPSSELLTRLAQEFDFNPYWIVMGKNPPSDGGEPSANMQGQGRVVRHAKKKKSVELIKRYTLNFSAGQGAFADDEATDGEIAFSTNWLRQRNINADLAGLVPVRGNSMEPTIPDGALVLVHAAEFLPKREGIYAIRFDGEAYVKRVVPSDFDEMNNPRSIAIISDNHSYPTKVFSGDWQKEVRILGRVHCAMIDF